MVIGSVHIFADEWIEEQENAKLQEVLFKWLLGEFNLDQIDSDSWDISDYHYLPNTAQLAERTRCCLQETEELPKEHTQMFDDTLFKFDTNLLPEVIQVYQEMGVKHETLTLIPPQVSNIHLDYVSYIYITLPIVDCSLSIYLFVSLELL